MRTLPSSLFLQLHLVPAGRRLDFEAPAGHYAYIYRRCQGQEWECVAQNARSPFLDLSPLDAKAVPEYMVRYRNANGATTANSSVVCADPAQLPCGISWISVA
jgi:hypothetical protein